jgi:hypothetical protein
MNNNPDESVTIIIILLIVCFVLVSGLITYGIYTCTGGSWKFGDWKFDTCFKTPDNTPAPAPAPTPEDNVDEEVMDQYNRANNPLDFFNIPEVSGTPHKAELYDTAKKGKCRPTYMTNLQSWFDKTTDVDTIDIEKAKAMVNSYKVGNIGNSGWSTTLTDGNPGRVIGGSETFKVEYITDDNTLIQTDNTDIPGDWEFEYVKLTSPKTGEYNGRFAFRSKKPIVFRQKLFDNSETYRMHLYFNPWTSHFTLAEYPETIDPSIFASIVHGGRNKRRNQSNMNIDEYGYIMYNIHGNLNYDQSYWNTEKTPVDQIKSFKFKVSLKSGQTITKSDVDVLHNYHNTLKNVCSKYDNTGDGIGGDGARPIGVDWGQGGESECQKVTMDHPDLAGIPFSKVSNKTGGNKQTDKYGEFIPGDFWNPFKPGEDLCRFEAVGKCFPLGYTGGKDDSSYSYNPYTQGISLELIDYEYLNKETVNDVVDNKISIDTQKVCTSIDNKRACDTRTGLQGHYNGILEQKGDKICRWWSGFRAFVKPTVRYDDGLDECIEGDQYMNMTGSCNTDPSYTVSETANICPEGTVTRKECNNMNNDLPTGTTRCNFQVQTGYARKDDAPVGRDELTDYILCGVCNEKPLYSRGGGKVNYDNVDTVARQGISITGNDVNPYTPQGCKVLLKNASTSNNSFFTIGVENDKGKGYPVANPDQADSTYYRDMANSGNAEDIKKLNEAGYFLGCKWDGDKNADKVCGEFNDNRGECNAHKHMSYRDAQEGACYFSSVANCNGKWEYPDKELNNDGVEVPNTCGARYPGLKRMRYREVTSAKAGGAPCDEEKIGWVEMPYPDLEEYNNVESTHYLTTVPSSNVLKGFNGDFEVDAWGYASQTNPKTNDFKFIPCDVDCVEQEEYKQCEFKGDTAEKRLDAAMDPMKRANYCEGQVVKYFGVKTKGEGNNGKKCPHFSLNESKSRVGQILPKDEATTESCTMPIINSDVTYGTCERSKCMANVDTINQRFKDINEGDYAVEITDENDVKTVYNKNNKMTKIEDLYTLYNAECQLIGMSRYNTEEERKLACTETNKKGSNSGDSEVFYDYSNESVCRTYDDDCGDESTGLRRVGVRLKKGDMNWKDHPVNFCKWIDAPTTDSNSTFEAYINAQTSS